MIVYVTTMVSMPKNCLNCEMACSLPVSSRDYTRVRKPYTTKRHPRCPLQEIPATPAATPERNCLTCSNSFSEAGDGSGDILHCMENGGAVVSEDHSCESWN